MDGWNSRSWLCLSLPLHLSHLQTRGVGNKKKIKSHLVKDKGLQRKDEGGEKDIVNS